MSTDNPQKAIKLLKPHRHAGRDYPVGATLNLPAHKAEWLVGIQVAAAASAAVPAVAPVEPKKAKD